jgi:hypothetical protein
MTNELITMQYVDQIFDKIRMSKTGWKAAFCTAEEVQGYKQAMVDALIYLNVTDHEIVSSAIRKAIISPGDFMPSVGTFCEWCRVDKKEQCHNLLPRLEHTESTPEQREQLRAAMSAALKGIK